mmetsp:Transcript_65378/g.105932  ORF Transcript_65378/g.105932 Transcript_65378/m.105932 type:complete len:129 (+) Transcript_65378:98-484(+)
MVKHQESVCWCVCDCSPLVMNLGHVHMYRNESVASPRRIGLKTHTHIISHEHACSWSQWQRSYEWQYKLQRDHRDLARSVFDWSPSFLFSGGEEGNTSTYVRIKNIFVSGLYTHSRRHTSICLREERY